MSTDTSTDTNIDGNLDTHCCAGELCMMKMPLIKDNNHKCAGFVGGFYGALCASKMIEGTGKVSCKTFPPKNHDATAIAAAADNANDDYSDDNDSQMGMLQ